MRQGREMRERSCGGKQGKSNGKIKQEARIERIKRKEEELRAGDKKWARGLIERK